MPEMRQSPHGFGPERFTFPYGGHVFVVVRPLERDWSEIDGSTFRQGRDEWRPAMVSGHGTGQSLRLIGSQYSYPMDEFEIGPLFEPASVAEAVPSPESPSAAGPRR